MQKYAGAGCIVLGVLLSGCGIDLAESIRGWTVNGPLMIGGILSLIVGVALWHLSGKAPPEEE